MGWWEKIKIISTYFTRTSVLPILTHYLHNLKTVPSASDRRCSSWWLPAGGGKRYSGSCQTAAISLPESQLLHNGMNFLWILDNASIIQEKKSASSATIQNQLLISQELATVLSSKCWQACASLDLQQALPLAEHWYIRSTSDSLVPRAETYFRRKLKKQPPTIFLF